MRRTLTLASFLTVVMIVVCACDSPAPVTSSATPITVSQVGDEDTASSSTRTPEASSVINQLESMGDYPAGEMCVPLDSSEKMKVMVSILPQKYFVERIGGEHLDVEVMVQPGESPVTYEPTPEQLKSLAQTTVYFSIGVPFESTWMDRIVAANPEIHVVDTTHGIRRRPLQPDSAIPDPHIWLSPALVKIQAQTIYETLVQLDCSHELDFQANLDSFLKDVDTLDANIRAALADTAGKEILVYHPCWGYFAEDYGLEMIPITVGDKEPDATELATLAREARDAGIGAVFTQPEFSDHTAQVLANEIGGQVIVICPLAPDWLDNLRQVAATFARVLG